ncbi:hypothetical protein C8R34_12127 [Nitrosomonas sp. Nm84]|nr:hypothetical protein C8R34_12127 [Nitrosomonas sp. Nm84]
MMEQYLIQQEKFSMPQSVRDVSNLLTLGE